MNSSTNPPSKQARKFQFDTDFEQEEEMLRQESQRQAEEQHQVAHAEPELPPAPTFSEDQIQYAREESQRMGYEQGLEEARKSNETVIARLVEQLVLSVETLGNNEEVRMSKAYEIAVRTVIATLKKAWPQIIQQMGLPLIEQTIRQSLEYNPEEARIVVRVHDSLLDSVVQCLPQLQSQQAFAGKIIVLSDPAILPGDCKVEWADGGLERLGRNLSAQIDQAMDRILSNLTQNTTDSERSSS